MSRLAPHAPLARYYGEDAAREAYVRGLFDAGAAHYERLDRVLSFGSGAWYRRQAIRRLGIEPGMRVLDLASGPGVLARAIAASGVAPRAIVGCDASFGMLSAGTLGNPRVHARGETLPFRDASFDRVTVGFALRHFADLSVLAGELFRVLRPGGKLLLLEITAPVGALARALLGAYMGAVAPAIVRLSTGERRAAEMVRYYWETTRDCVRPEVILAALRAAGFTEVRRQVVLGIFSEYTAAR